MGVKVERKYKNWKDTTIWFFNLLFVEASQGDLRYAMGAKYGQAGKEIKKYYNTTVTGGGEGRLW
jgi:hypothetical protein